MQFFDFILIFKSAFVSNTRMASTVLLYHQNGITFTRNQNMHTNMYTMRTTQRPTSTETPIAYAEHKIRTDVVLGSPSANCSGVGICRVMAQGENTETKCPRVATWVSVTKEGKIRFEFEKDSMEGRYMRRHFRWLLFQVFEPCLVPYNLLRSTKIEQRTIRPGIYQVWDSGERLIVEF